MKNGDRVEIKEAAGKDWKWTGRYGIIVDTDEYCFTVSADDGDRIRDVKEHFRPESS